MKQNWGPELEARSWVASTSTSWRSFPFIALHSSRKFFFLIILLDCIWRSHWKMISPGAWTLLDVVSKSLFFTCHLGKPKWWPCVGRAMISSVLNLPIHDHGVSFHLIKYHLTSPQMFCWCYFPFRTILFLSIRLCEVCISIIHSSVTFGSRLPLDWIISLSSVQQPVL